MQRPKIPLVLSVFFFVLTVLFVDQAHALSCKVPAHRVVMYCSAGECAHGFRVYHLPTGFPCGTRPVVAEAVRFHSNLLHNMLTLGEMEGADGVYEVSFASCTKDAVEAIPWDKLRAQTKDWKNQLVQELDWQVNRDEERVIVLGRNFGCALSLSRQSLGDTNQYLENLRTEYIWEARIARISSFFFLWLMPLAIVPLLASVAGWASLMIFRLAESEPRKILWLGIPVLVQLSVFLYVLEPATDIWMGKYRFLFLLPCALISVLWLFQLIYLWKFISELIDSLQPKSETEAEQAVEDEQPPKEPT